MPWQSEQSASAIALPAAISTTAVVDSGSFEQALSKVRAARPSRIFFIKTSLVDNPTVFSDYVAVFLSRLYRYFEYTTNTL
jgi:hypothetical protein